MGCTNSKAMIDDSNHHDRRSMKNAPPNFDTGQRFHSSSVQRSSMQPSTLYGRQGGNVVVNGNNHHSTTAPVAHPRQMYHNSFQTDNSNANFGMMIGTQKMATVSNRGSRTSKASVVNSSPYQVMHNHHTTTSTAVGGMNEDNAGVKEHDNIHFRRQHFDRNSVLRHSKRRPKKNSMNNSNQSSLPNTPTTTGSTSVPNGGGGVGSQNHTSSTVASNRVNTSEISASKKAVIAVDDQAKDNTIKTRVTVDGRDSIPKMSEEQSMKGGQTYDSNHNNLIPRSHDNYNHSDGSIAQKTTLNDMNYSQAHQIQINNTGDYFMTTRNTANSSYNGGEVNLQDLTNVHTKQINEIFLSQQHPPRSINTKVCGNKQSDLKTNDSENVTRICTEKQLDSVNHLTYDWRCYENRSSSTSYEQSAKNNNSHFQQQENMSKHNEKVYLLDETINGNRQHTTYSTSQTVKSLIEESSATSNRMDDNENIFHTISSSAAVDSFKVNVPSGFEYKNLDLRSMIHGGGGGNFKADVARHHNDKTLHEHESSSTRGYEQDRRRSKIEMSDDTGRLI